MAKIKAVQVPKVGADLELVEREIPKPGAGQVRIHMQACEFPWCSLKRGRLVTVLKEVEPHERGHCSGRSIPRL
jgi:hypothetical protein